MLTAVAAGINCRLLRTLPAAGAGGGCVQRNGPTGSAGGEAFRAGGEDIKLRPARDGRGGDGRGL